MTRHMQSHQVFRVNRLHYFVAMISMIVLSACALDTSGALEGSKPAQDPTLPFACSSELLSRYPEACNGLDDDCDDAIDEGLVGCDHGTVELPFRLCTSNCCIADQACDDNQVCRKLGDQGRCESPCQDGEFRLCTFGCEPEFQECLAGVWDRCLSRRPQPERCNDTDDDCDGSVDEDLMCEEVDGFHGRAEMGMEQADMGLDLDAELRQDLGVNDMMIAGPTDVEVDAAQTPDADLPTEPECTRHAQCGPFTLCLNQSCQTALPGRFNIILVSARVDEEIGDSFSFGFGGEPDLFADVRMGETVLGSPTPVEENVYAAVWNHRVTLELTTQQTLSLCVWDDDGGLRGDDDLAGCATLSSDGIVEQIRTFQGTRMRPNWASLRPQITSGQHIEDFLIHVDRF